MTWLLANWKLVAIVAVIGGLTSALGVQSYRLLGMKAERDLLALEKTERQRRDALRAAQDEKNRERTDEEFAAASARAAVVRVQPAVPAPGIIPFKVAAAGDPETAARCGGRRVDEIVAAVSQRFAESARGIIAEFARHHADGTSAAAQRGEGVAAAYRACRAYTLNLSE